MAARAQRGSRPGKLAMLEHLLRGSDNAFFDLFEQAGANVVRAAELLHEMLVNCPDRQELARDIVVCEHDGDNLTHEVIRRLNESFVTPIDREDVLALSSALDDIVDFTEEVADYLILYRIEAPMLQAQALANVLVDATRQLFEALKVVGNFADLSVHTVEVHRLENEGDRLVRGAIASLFEGAVDPMVVIRWKDIFERLEDAIDSTERAAFVLEGIVIKNT
jgi:predicted phosphate transport protein (TIGR00153 family)